MKNADLVRMLTEQFEHLHEAVMGCYSISEFPGLVEAEMHVLERLYKAGGVE